MKKLLFFSMLFEIWTISANAQMMDLMGSMAIGGAMDAGSVKSVGTMNRQLKKTQFVSDIQMKVVDIMTTYAGQYQRLKPSQIKAGGVNVVFSSAENGRAFQATVKTPNLSTCQTLLTTYWDGASYLNIATDGQTQKMTLSEAASSADKMCQKAKAVSIIYQ